MKRNKMRELLDWKHSITRKPMIFRGARQVGKTWLMKEFGKKYYENIAYFNFEKLAHLKNIFTGSLNIQNILLALQAEGKFKIEPETTLIIFDEIQTIPEALTALKYFQEDAPEYHVMAAGSLLGVALNQQVSFPVGKVNFINLFPMNFEEFMMAMNENQLLELIKNKKWELVKRFSEKFIHLLRSYYFVGGMPEAVNAFKQTQDFAQVRSIQENILTAYENDFSKHAPLSTVPRIRLLWNSIPAQLAKENKKFIYGKIKTGARSKDYEMALSWLEDCGLIHKVLRISKPALPLKAYTDNNSFKLFVLDIGLLTALSNLDAATIINSNKIFTEFKGSITEQFVLQELITQGIYPNYWSAEKATAEIDFVVQQKEIICPIEVKAEENLQAKSLKVYQQKYSPQISIRCSLSDYKEQENLVNIPLYAVGILQSKLLNC